MSDKKNIDRLFQEKFKNFEVAPDEAVWEKIKSRKNKDRKRILIIPFWYRIAGVAALVAVILSIGSILLPNNKIQDSIVVTEGSDNNNSLSTENKNNSTSIKDLVDSTKDKESMDNEGASENTHTNNEAVTSNSLKTVDKKNNQPAITSDQKTSISNTYNTPHPNEDITNKKDAVTITSSKNKRTVSPINGKKKGDVFFKQKTTPKSTLTDTQKTTNSETNKKETAVAISDMDAKTGILKNNTSVNNKSGNKTKEKDLYILDPTKSNGINREAIAENIEETQNENKKEISDEASNQSQDSGKKSIFDAIKEKEEKEAIIAETKPTAGKRWNIAPNVAPVYYDSFGGSSIDPEFSDNTKQGQVNLSYGIQVAYSINKRLSVRSGVSKVDVGYNTEDVGFGVSSVARGGVAGDGNVTNIQSIVVSDYQGASAVFSPVTDVNNEILVKSQNPGLLNHSIGYVEVPIELKYALTESKLGIHMIGGISTLFLEDDEVSIIAGSFKNENVARNETVNDVSFSGNIGLGFDYKLSDQFQINMEPIFKYQFNGFKDSAENFKPYYFGVYTGISFKF